MKGNHARRFRLVLPSIHQRPRTWKGDLQVLYELLDRIGAEALFAALQGALLRGLIGAEYVCDLARREVSA